MSDTNSTPTARARVRWKPEWDAIMVGGWSDVPQAEWARRFGASLDAVRKHAARLGLLPHVGPASPEDIAKVEALARALHHAFHAGAVPFTDRERWMAVALVAVVRGGARL